MDVTRSATGLLLVLYPFWFQPMKLSCDEIAKRL
jgi:hypothetical protein